MFMSDIKMPLSEALAVSLIGIVTVMVILAVIAVLIILVSKCIRAIEAKVNEPTFKISPAVSSAVPTEKASQGQVELIDTDEKTAAVIMAVVANKTGIPLERLSFKSIRLLGEEKGEK